MRLAIFGGSFDPIHLGHLFLAKTVLLDLHYERIVLVPAYRSPFKPDAKGMEETSNDRLKMIAASIAGDPSLTVDDCEIKRGGVSYTVDTVKDIIQRYKSDGKPGLIIGDDLAQEFPEWRHSNEILEMADIIIARRIHSKNITVPYSNIQIENNIIDITSGMVRELISQGGAWYYLVPPCAAAIIEKRKLYGFKQEPLPLPPSESKSSDIDIKNLILRIEKEARESLNMERFLHSRNTAILAWDMCCHFKQEYPSLVPELGYLAGIAHDIGKPLGRSELFSLVKSANMKISSLEKDKPSLLHGKAGAVLLKKRFKVDNEDVLEAVALHTSGSEKMSPLAKVIFIADKMELSRDKAEPAVRKKIFECYNLDEVFFDVFDQNIKGLLSRKLKLSKETLKLISKRKEIV